MQVRSPNALKMARETYGNVGVSRRISIGLSHEENAKGPEPTQPYGRSCIPPGAAGAPLACSLLAPWRNKKKRSLALKYMWEGREWVPASPSLSGDGHFPAQHFPPLPAAEREEPGRGQEANTPRRSKFPPDVHAAAVDGASGVACTNQKEIKPREAGQCCRRSHPLVPRRTGRSGSLCVCLASRGLTVLWKVCFVNIYNFFSCFFL